MSDPNLINPILASVVPSIFMVLPVFDYKQNYMSLLIYEFAKYKVVNPNDFVFVIEG